MAATVAPEDLARGTFVAIQSEIVELPSFLWWNSLSVDPSELVRLRFLPTEDRMPLKIKEICLPFVFVKLPTGPYRTIDIRLTALVRLDKQYAKAVWNILKKPPLKTRLAGALKA